MNIVIVNHYVGGPRFGMEFRPYYLASEWQKLGHKVLLIGASFSHLRSRQPEVKKRIQWENIDGVNYVWIKTNSYDGNGIGRILSIFNFTTKLYYTLSGILKTFNPDLIIASSTYPLDNLPLRRLASKHRASLCYEVHDLWPLSPMELGGYTKNHPFIRVMQYAEDFAYRTSDFVVSILPNTLDHMISRGLNPLKFCYIPNGIVVKEWEGIDMEHVHRQFLSGLRETYQDLVGYVGGHSISNALDNLLAAASLAKSAEPGLAFVLVGSGTDKQRLMNLANDQNLTNVFFLDPVPKQHIPALLRSLDILYIGWHNNPLYRFGISPNKLMDYMMAEKPIVHAVNAANDFVAESGCGISVKPDHPDSVVEALKSISAWTPKERRDAGANGKEFVLKNHNYEVLAQKFIDFAQGKNSQ